MSTRSKRRKEQRPEEILQAALEEFIAKGYAGTRLEDVARSTTRSSDGTANRDEYRTATVCSMKCGVIIITGRPGRWTR